MSPGSPLSSIAGEGFEITHEWDVTGDRWMRYCYRGDLFVLRSNPRRWDCECTILVTQRVRVWPDNLVCVGRLHLSEHTRYGSLGSSLPRTAWPRLSPPYVYTLLGQAGGFVYVFCRSIAHQTPHLLATGELRRGRP